MSPHPTRADAVLGITAAILILLFSSQRFGTAWVGGTFAPIVIVWLGLNAGVGIYNLATSGGAIFKALNPAEIVWFFQREGKAGECAPQRCCHSPPAGPSQYWHPCQCTWCSFA
jgi:KUP system potassium uptake protein